MSLINTSFLILIGADVLHKIKHYFIFAIFRNRYKIFYRHVVVRKDCTVLCKSHNLHLFRRIISETVTIMPREMQPSKKSIEYSQLSIKESRREFIIFSHARNIDDNAFTSLHIENINQLKYGMKKNLVQLKNAGIDMKMKNEKLVTKINDEVKDHFRIKNQLHDKISAYLTLKMKMMKMKKNMKKIVQSIERDNVTRNHFIFHQKDTTSKKLLDSFIFIDVIESDIKKGLPVMKNKLTDNIDGYSTDFHEIIYVRTKIEGKALKHISIKLKKKTKKSFIKVEKIFEVLGQIYDDFNQRVNVMKTFKRFKQINFFKKFTAFGTEFQRLTIDAEMNDIEILLKDLKNKMSYKLQKIMAVNVYESTDLYEFAKKCQYINQIFRDVKNRSKYNRTDDNEIITFNDEILFANIKIIISTIETSSFHQITSASRFIITSTASFKAVNQQSFEVSQINVMKCYNCNKMSYIVRNCLDSSVAHARGAVIKEITIDDIENEESRKE